MALRVRRRADATSGSVVRLELTDGETDNVLAVIIEDTAVDVATWAILEGTFDAAVLPDLSGEVTVRVVDEADEPSLEVGALTWSYESLATAFIRVFGELNIESRGRIFIRPLHGRILPRVSIGLENPWGSVITIEPPWQAGLELTASGA
jgi:hypothetical protein